MEDSYWMSKFPENWSKQEGLGLLEYAVAHAMDDWLHVAEFSSIAKRSGVSNAEGIRALGIGLITQALVDDLMVAGDVDDFGFHSWPGTTADAIVKIAQSWDPNEPFPPPGSVAWLANTPRGERLGSAIRAGEVDDGPKAQ
jgi:hypothetical protein